MKIKEFNIKVDHNGFITECTQTPVTGRKDRTQPVNAAVKAIETTVQSTKSERLSIAERAFVRVNAIPGYKILGAFLILLGAAGLLVGIADAALLLMALGLGSMFSPLVQPYIELKNTEIHAEDPECVYSSDLR